MKTQPSSTSQRAQGTPPGYEPVLSAPVEDPHASTAHGDTVVHESLAARSSAAVVIAEDFADVGESAGVNTGGVPSLGASQDNSACVITGGDNVLRLRLAHTRFPWLDDFMPHMAGHRKGGKGRALFDMSELTEVEVPDGEERFVYFVDLFFQKRFYAKHRDMRYDPAARSSPDSLAEAWSEFISSMRNNHMSWMDNFENLKKGFMNRDISGQKILVHQLSRQEGIACCVLKDQGCPMCYSTSIKATKTLRKNQFGQISDALHAAIKRLDAKWQHYAVALERDQMRSRAAQEDVMDGIPLAQVEPMKTIQRLRDIETQLSFIQDSSDQLTASIQTLIKDGDGYSSELRSLEYSLTMTQNKLYEDGVFQRPRHS